VQRAFEAKLIEVASATDVAALGGTLTDDEIAEKAVKLLPEGVRLRFEWEKEAKAEGVYSMTAKDVRLLVRHGVQRLSRAVPASDNIFEEGFPSWIRSRGFHPWLRKAINFGSPVDVTADMLCVLRSHLLQFAEQVKEQQVETPAQNPATARVQEAEPKTGDVQTHQEQAAPAKPKRLTQADRIEGWVIECERRAEALGEPFDRQRMPGKMQDFLDLLHALDAELRSIAKVSTLRDNYTKKLKICKWGDDAGAQPSALPLYARLFPEAKNIAPGVTSAQRRKA
jgi:hypothetical protein